MKMQKITVQVEAMAEEIKSLKEEAMRLRVENKDLAEAWKTLKDFNDNTDNQEDERIKELEQQVNDLVEQRDSDLVLKSEIEELEQALAKSEARVKELGAHKKRGVISIYETLMRSGWHIAAMLNEGFQVNVMIQEDHSIKVRGERAK